jgi:hypothetical protein
MAWKVICIVFIKRTNTSANYRMIVGRNNVSPDAPSCRDRRGLHQRQEKSILHQNHQGKKEHHVHRLHLAFTETRWKVLAWSISIWCAAQQRGREESIRIRSKFFTSLLALIAHVNKTRMSRICFHTYELCAVWIKPLTYKYTQVGEAQSWEVAQSRLKKKTLADIPRAPRSHNCRRWASRWPRRVAAHIDEPINCVYGEV